MSVGHPEPRAPQIRLTSLYPIEVLKSRSGRGRGSLSEIAAYERLHETLLRTPGRLLQDLVETAMALFAVGTVGISLLESRSGEGDIFRWCALAGSYAHALNTTLPRNRSPCGHVVELSSPLLLRHPLSDFPMLRGLEPVEEALLVPFYLDDVAVGTLWLVLHREGEQFDYEDAQQLIRLSHFAAMGYRVLQDSRAAAEREAQDARAARHKDEFLAMLAHELRNPLSSLSNAATLLQRVAGKAPDAARPLEILGRQTQQLTRLVDDLLDISRIATGRIALESHPVALETIIEQVLDGVQPALREKGHQLTVSIAPQPSYVLGDRARLVQALSNVMHNAVKYTDAGGRIALLVSHQDGQVAIEVRDDGVGIAAELLPHVFDLFVQSERTLDRSQGGLGIGLSVVKRLIEMQGGSVGVSSDGIGHGASFTIRLPLIEAPATPPARVTTTESCSRKRILVVDDNVDAADSLALLLSFDRHEVHTVYDGIEAIEAAHERLFDVIILDIGLPQLDGYEVARRIRARKNDSVLVALTGYGQAEDLEQARAAGFDAHLMKPVALEELKRVLDRPSAAQA